MDVGPNILAHVHKYPPRHNAGAEWYLHTVLRSLADAGAQVRVGVRDDPRATEFQGITILANAELEEQYTWADVVLTHLDCTPIVMRLAQQYHKPLVHFVHNDRQLAYHQVGHRDAALIAFNSQWIADMIAWPWRSIVVPPPVFAAEYRVRPTGKALTLVNLSKAKGAELFYDLAARMPEAEFIGVQGAYGVQVVEKHPNVTILENTPDIRQVYRQTRILLMPSSYESWGRVGVEAAASGIPTIAAPTPGLRESLGNAGIFVDLEDVEGWEAQIRRLGDPQAYGAARKASRARSAELDPTESLKALQAAVWRVADAV